jgi:cytidylate kinase
MGLSTFELNKYAETHPEIDERIDGELRALSDYGGDIVIDSRMAWHFVKNTFKVYLAADETIAAKRVISDKRGPCENYIDVEQAKARLKERRESETLRYSEKYGVDCLDLTNYDLVVDTTQLLPEDIAELIMEAYARHLYKQQSIRRD